MDVLKSLTDQHPFNSAFIKSAWGFIPNTLTREVYVVIFVPVARFPPSPDDRGGPLHRVVLFLSSSTFRRRTGPRGEEV